MGRISAFFGFVLGWISTVIDSFVHKKLYTGKIIFNCAWEDPALDLEALKLTKDDNIVVITSAGCNVLTYAIHEPNHIYSIDRNPCQNALLELKIAAIKNLISKHFGRCSAKDEFQNSPKNIILVFENIYLLQVKHFGTRIAITSMEKDSESHSSITDAQDFWHGLL